MSFLHLDYHEEKDTSNKAETDKGSLVKQTTMMLRLRTVAVFAALLPFAPSPVDGGKGKSGSRRSSSTNRSRSTSTSSSMATSSSSFGSGSSSKSSGSSHSSGSSSRNSSRSRSKGKSSYLDVPDDLFETSASGSSDEEYPAMSPAMQDLLFRSSEETNSTTDEGSNGVMPFPGAAPVPPPNALPTLPNPSDDNAKCVTTNGTFGLPLEAAQEQLVVSFLYTVTLMDSSELTQEEYLSSVVPNLETEMNNFVVPVLFGKACGGAQERRPHHHHRALRERHGISALPADRINDDDDGVGFCADTAAAAGTEESDKCYSMLGQVTLYLNNTQRRLEDDAALFQATLQSGMNEGVFDNQPPIQSVAFIPTDRGAGDDKDGSSQSSGGPDVHRIVTITWFTILGLLLVSAVIYVVLRLRRSGGDDEQMQSLSQRA